MSADDHQPRSAAAVDERPDLDAASLISVRGLRVHFETKRGRAHAVDGVDLDIRDGETIGLVGETGSGKSVTARSLLRLVPMPPGVLAGGSVLYRPKQVCGACSGSGCTACGQVGRRPIACRACDGAGCEACEHTGRHTVDLLRISDTELREIRGNRIAMIFQDPGKALNPALTIRQQIAEVFLEHRSGELLQAAGLEDGDRRAGRLMRRSAHQRVRGIERLMLKLPPWRGRQVKLSTAIDDAVIRALEDTRIPNPRKILTNYPHELSGGMKQRVMIAQALACDPDLLIADEPTTALDVTIQARILDLISELQQRRGTAVLYISHDLSLVKRVCDRVAVLYAGQIAEVSDVAELFRRPMHPYTRGLLAAVPSAEQQRGQLRAIRGTVPELVDPEPACRFHTRCDAAVPLCASREPVLWERGDGAAPHRVACFAHADPQVLGVDRRELPVLDEGSS
ncbi:MAG: ABC transporter ATP-binding protein [Actinobacteria bacterium]|jgi:oligopeptide/dipeptide ABC transporter ATP-binding protein|nr:ABC transporter ATP-binding protein [Actinomycetota bacterium]